MKCTELPHDPNQLSSNKGQWRKQSHYSTVRDSAWLENRQPTSAYTSAAAKISHHCLHSVCNVWVTSCLEKEEHSFLSSANVLCQPAGVREEGQILMLTVELLVPLDPSIPGAGLVTTLMDPRDPQVKQQRRPHRNRDVSHSTANIMQLLTANTVKL